MKFTDTHTHIYLDAFQDDRQAMIGRSLGAGVDRLFLPAIDSEHHEDMIALASAYPAHCFAMMGLHPTSVKENFHKELDIVRHHLKNQAIPHYAIGEVGIDLYWDKTYKKEQEEVLEQQFDLSLQYKLPLVIHTRNSMDIVLDMLENRHDPRLRGIFHCFGGNTRQAERVAGLGFLLGIGGVITYKNSGLQQVVMAIGPDHLVLETDAPYLPPVPHRGERNEPAYIPLIAGKIAEICQLSLEKVALATQENAARVFGFHKSTE
jgi:TatD DNase family protein